MSLFASHLPSSTSDLPFASPVLAKVATKLASGQLFDHLLLYGDPGTGKSTIVETILRDRYPQVAPNVSVYVYEGANWSSNTLTGGVLGQLDIDPMLGIKQSFTIVNEVDLLSSKHMAELKAFMDKWPQHKFLLTTNHIGKVPANVQSRCSQHKVDFPPAQSVAPFLQQVVAAQGHTLTAADAQTLIDHCNGDWRRLERNVRSLLP